MPHIESLHIYPVKSCAAATLADGASIKDAYLGLRGMSVGNIGDRRWMLVSGDTMLRQTEAPELACVRTELINHACTVRLTRPQAAPLLLKPGATDKGDLFWLHTKQVPAHYVGDEADAWFSDFLGRPVRLVYQTDADLRPVNADYAPEGGAPHVSLADGFQLLVTNTATLGKLNVLLPAAIPMDRFRPNIVLADALADAEYGWQSLHFNTAIIELVKPCDRCPMTAIDQQTGQKTGKEPLRTLAKHYFYKFGEQKNGAIFGENGVPMKCGRVHVGDRVRPVLRKAPRQFARAKQG